MTAAQWARVVAKDPRYAAVTPVLSDGPPRPAGGQGVCRHLGELLPVGLHRRACGKGRAGPPPAGFPPCPGVRPCRDCGPAKCPDYAPGEGDG